MDIKAKIKKRKSKNAVLFSTISAFIVIVFLFFTPLIHNMSYEAENGMSTIFSTQNPGYITRFSYISVMKNIVIILQNYGDLSYIAGVAIGAYLMVPFIAMVIYLVAILYALVYGMDDNSEESDIKRKFKTMKKLFKSASIISAVMFLIDILVAIGFDIFVFKTMAVIPGITVIIGLILTIMCVRHSNRI